MAANGVAVAAAASAAAAAPAANAAAAEKAKCKVKILLGPDKTISPAMYDENVAFLNKLTEKDYSIIGAGPVGLWTALTLLQHSTLAKTVLFEIRIPNRAQILHLFTRLWIDLPLKLRYMLEEEKAACFFIYKDGKTCELEKNLKIDDIHDYAIKFITSKFQEVFYRYLIENYPGRVKIIYLQRKDPSVALYSDMHVGGEFNIAPQNIILCNGPSDRNILKYVRSKNKGSVDSIRISSPGSFMADDKPDMAKKEFNKFYEIKVASALVNTFNGTLKRFPFKEEDAPFLGKLSNQFFFRFMSTPPDPDNENKTNSYMAVQISAASHAKLTAAGDKTAAIKELDEYKIMQYAKKKLFEINADGKVIGGEDTDKIDEVPIKVSTAPKFFYNLDSKNYWIVGDAAFTTHFFTGTGLEYGFQSARLATTLLTLPTQLDPIYSELKGYTYNNLLISMRNNLWTKEVASALINVPKIIAACKKGNEVDAADPTAILLEDGKTYNGTNMFTNMYNVAVNPTDKKRLEYYSQLKAGGSKQFAISAQEELEWRYNQDNFIEIINTQITTADYRAAERTLVEHLKTFAYDSSPTITGESELTFLNTVHIDRTQALRKMQNIRSRRKNAQGNPLGASENAAGGYRKMTRKRRV